MILVYNTNITNEYNINKIHTNYNEKVRGQISISKQNTLLFNLVNFHYSKLFTYLCVIV